MSEHENGNFVLKCGQNQQKYQLFMAISDFALLYRIRRCGARFRLLSLLIPPVLFLENTVSIRRIGTGMQVLLWISFPALFQIVRKGDCGFPKNWVYSMGKRGLYQKGDEHMSYVVLTKENFHQEVILSDRPVLVDFWASWCGPCQALAPTIDEIADEQTAIKVGKVNVDEQPELARQFRVMSIPTLMVFKNGDLVHREVGGRSKEDILALVD